MQFDVNGKYGRLRPIEKVGRDANRQSLWRCKCDCGNEIIVRQCQLATLHTKSCGCLRSEKASQTARNFNHDATITHGGTRNRKQERLYVVWHDMKARCGNPHNKCYSVYGGRGIKVCEAWLEYAPFKKWALENGYDFNAPHGECTLDRIDVNGNYEPNNCRWVDMKVQAQNRRKKSEG